MVSNPYVYTYVLVYLMYTDVLLMLLYVSLYSTHKSPSFTF